MIELASGFRKFLLNSGCTEGMIEKLQKEEDKVRGVCEAHRTLESWKMYNFPIYCLVRVFKPKICVETGVTGGTQTTCAILCAIKENKKGFLYTINAKKLKKRIPKNLKKSRLQVMLGDTQKMLFDLRAYRIKEGEKVDFFFHDSEHSDENIDFEFKTISDVATADCLYGIHDPHPIHLSKEFQLVGGDPAPHFRVFQSKPVVARYAELTEKGKEILKKLTPLDTKTKKKPKKVKITVPKKKPAPTATPLASLYE